MSRFSTCAAAGLALTLSSAAALAQSGAEARARPAAETSLSLPFEKYVLDNGLTVVLHRDATVPLVAVNMMVRVGSRFEEPKRTGFAHLFEHLMFMGTRRVPTKMFDAWMEAEGGSNNAWTSEDRTDYFEVGPAHTLPLLLWLEADRFASLGAEMTQAKLDAQREVVRNERRQTSENTPYGKVELRLPELLFPEGHPYHHPVIGSHEDLQAATVEDVKAFFARWYVPSNASLVVAGDFDPADAKARIARLFGSLPRGQVSEPPPPPPVKLGGIVRDLIEDDVNLAKVVMAWHSPARFAPGDAELDLLSEVLEHGKASRLYKALVYDKALAQEVGAHQESRDLGSVYVVEAIARPNVSLDDLEAAIDAELAKVRSEPVGEAELVRAKNQYETAFVSRLQSILQRASLLNTYETFKGNPGFADEDLARYRAVTPEAIRKTAQATLDPNARVILRVVPRGTAAQHAVKAVAGAKKTDAAKPVAAPAKDGTQAPSKKPDAAKPDAAKKDATKKDAAKKPDATKKPDAAKKGAGR